MAVTKGRSARKPVKAAVVAALRASASTPPLAVPSGDSALSGYSVGVWGDVPQGAAFPYVRVDAGLEVENSTFGRNGKDVAVIVHIFDNVESDERRAEVASRVLALLNPSGNYASLSVSGYTTESVKFDQVEEHDPEELAGRKIGHTSVKVNVLVRE